MTPSELTLAVIAGLSLLATVIYSGINSRQAARSATAAEKSAVSAQGSLELAQEQLRTSVKAHVDTLQPYVWADLRGREDGSGLMVLVVGNSGPTVATNVRIQFQPALDHVVPSGSVELAHAIQDLLNRGLKSLAPGRVFMWNLGVSYDYFGANQPPARELTLTISGDGPHGSMATSIFTVAIDDQAKTSLRPAGLGLVEKPLTAIEKRLQEIVGRLDKMQRTIPTV